MSYNCSNIDVPGIQEEKELILRVCEVEQADVVEARVSLRQ